MAIFSCHHGKVGRSTHAAGTAGAHVRYITRPEAVSEIVAENMPGNRHAARAWLDGQEAADRANARVIDKVMVALPHELDAAQRVQLVRDFAVELGGGRVPWLGAIHERGEDEGNPHAHIVFRDRDIDSGKRVVGFSEKGSTERVRETWERMANQALERAGLDIRIDRRSLEAQGLEREAGIHIGAPVLAMHERGEKPTSKAQEIERRGGGARIIDWPVIDQGHTRIDRQAEIETRNARHLALALPVLDVPKVVTFEKQLTLDALDRRTGGREPAREAMREPVQAPIAYTAESVVPALEAPQRSSYEPGVGDAGAPIAGPRSRLRQAIDAARERVHALGDRLERAFDRFQQGTRDPVRERRDCGEARRSLFLGRSRGHTAKEP